MLTLLKKVMSLNTTIYRGVTIMKRPDGYHVYGVKHDTMDQAKEAVDASYKNLYKTIKN